ncbi:hypothetical protein BHE74_00029328 [Ensete ventricosum]|nr:hypothetical protein BHE74_00029328 [Ensete ventricosum]RZS07172.1 hypothetical protein BHM03_00037961 [Ensete ventricosum]
MAVNTISARVTSTESTERTSISRLAAAAFTSWAYSVAARASTVSGKEYAHHATLKCLMDRLNSAGRDTCSTKPSPCDLMLPSKHTQTEEFVTDSSPLGYDVVA